MPLFFQQALNAETKLAVWKIEETEAFFNAHVPLQREITHPHKRLQHLAGRYLLNALYPHFPLALVQIADTRKPFLEDELFHFSISHCDDFAAAIVSTRHRVGIDIETTSNKIEKVQHKFVSEEEMKVVNGEWSIVNKKSSLITHHALLTLIWSCKEAVFKWYGLGGVDFKKHIQIKEMKHVDGNLFQTTMLFTKEDRALGLQSVFFNGVCLSFLVT